MGWDGEADFKHALRQVARSATRDRLELVAIAAVEEEEVAYKVVAHLLLKTLKEVKPDSRLRVFYGLSAVARQSVARRGAGSKYVRRLEPQLDAVATLLGEAPDKDRALVARVLELWWREGVFSPPAVAKLQAQFPAAAAAAPAAAAAQAPPAAAVHVAAAGGNEEEQYVLPTQYAVDGATSLSFGGQDEGPEAKKRKTRWESTGGTP